MTEERIERLAEAMMDSIDRRFGRGEWTQAQYDQIVRDLDRWVESAYRGSVSKFTIREF